MDKKAFPIHNPEIKFVISNQKEISAMALVTVAAILWVIMSSCLFGQAGAPPKRFEIASVKLRKSVTLSSNRTVAPGGRLTVTNATLKSLIQWSYGLSTFQISGGPGWLDSDRFDIEAKPEESATHLEIMQMLQTLLAERFKLAVHHETKEVSVYALVLAKGGPKLHEVKEDNANSTTGLRDSNGHIAATKSPMTALARVLAREVERTVLDRTGLTGKYVSSWTGRQIRVAEHQMFPEFHCSPPCRNNLA